MDPPEHPPGQPSERGKGRGGRGGKGKSTQGCGEEGTRFQINWRKDTSLTDGLVQWLVQHLADCMILFGGKPNETFGPSSGKDKNAVYTAIAKSIFQHGDSRYDAFPDKFRDSVSNRIQR